VGDRVLLWNLRRADRKGGKMADPWLGRYTVNAILKNGLYELRNANNEVLKTKQHGVNLKLFFEREPSSDNREGEDSREGSEDKPEESTAKRRKLSTHGSPS